MGRREIPHDRVMAAATRMAEATLADMFGEGCGATVLHGDLDGIGADDAFEALEAALAPVMVVSGDWRDSPGVDVYDLVTRFAEEHFSKVRHKKFPTGMYVAVMGDLLQEGSEIGGEQGDTEC